MVKMDEHIKKMEDIKRQADNSKGQKRLQLMKCYHKLNKELLQCQMYLNNEMK